MYAVTVNSDSTTFFFNIEEATKFAESKANNSTFHDHGTVCYTSWPRVVIHELQPHKEYTNDYLSIDQYAIKIYNDDS